MSVDPVLVARQAMATRFEIAQFGDDEVALRAAAEEALDEVQRVEALLSWRLPSSQIARLNAQAATQPVRVNPELFTLLLRCRELWELGNHAFDITVGPLMHAWGFHADEGQRGDDAALARAREACGMQHLVLDATNSTVRYGRPGMKLDFGAIGKGYALDLATEVLRDAGVVNALIHGGTSTVCALGHPPEADNWKIAVEYPPGEHADETLPALAVIELREEALSVSAVWGRVFRVGEDTFGHVIDPRTGAPTHDQFLSIYVCDQATEADAMSTALLTEGGAGVKHFQEKRATARTLVLGRGQDGEEFAVAAHGIDWRPRGK